MTDYVDEAMELIGVRKIITEVSGFYPLFELLIDHYGNIVTPAVFGAVWRYCQMEDGVCKASLRTLASKIGVDPATVMRHVDILCADGFLKDLTPDLRNRPHVYADTGKVSIRSKLTVAQRNTTVAQRNTTVAQSQLNKDLNKDSNKEPTTRGGDIFRVYQEEIGVLTPMIADALKDAETTYPDGWAAAAIHEAAANNKRNWKYCEAILKRWQAQGFRDDGKKPENTRTGRKRNNSSTPAPVQLSPDELEKLRQQAAREMV